MRSSTSFTPSSPKNNKPPVADAGPEKELTLPVDRTTLDGGRSSDDQQIASYRWQQTKCTSELDQPPVARVVSPPPVTLPVRTGSLDGSRSSDDKGVIYLWTRDDSSPAAGEVLNNSDRQALLFLGNLVAGKYGFTLTVTDGKGQSSTARGTLEVKAGEPPSHAGLHFTTRRAA
ncbi:Dyslexia-associated protein KIAA0319-like protein [Liparis tanakae]|uniref:Dyslexia-associated protein KIAA0319-like protein n=1 Tax=Liparis tanakae TaxID=230148 RepID=A0A4Z2EI18_9TELE|nr:Dyslexia-associated protein KIAA0319-like protein [Liparis tanakae]